MVPKPSPPTGSRQVGHAAVIVFVSVGNVVIRVTQVVLVVVVPAVGALNPDVFGLAGLQGLGHQLVLDRLRQEEIDQVEVELDGLTPQEATKSVQRSGSG